MQQQKKYFSSQQIIKEEKDESITMDTSKKESKNELIAIDDEDDELSDVFQERMTEKIYKAKEYMLKGDVMGLDRYIKETAELRDKGTNVLHLAAMAGDAEMIKKAITEHNFNPNESDYDGTKPLHWAAFHGNVKSGRALLSLGANPNLTDNDGQTPLNINLKTFKEEFVELLVREFNADINLKDKEGNSYLNILCLSGEFEIACNIVEKYSDLLDFNTVNNNGESPIHHVCCMSDPETVDLFIQKGATLNVFTKEEQSPFHYAVLNNNFETAESLLKKYNYDINVCRRDIGEMIVDSLTPLHVCAKNKELEGAKWLLLNGANFDIQTEDGYTCLHVACEEGDVEMVQLLLDTGANPVIGTNSGVLPLHIAANNPKGTKCLKVLLNHLKVDPNVFDNSFYSPLHYASSVGSNENVKLLLEYHSNINIKGDTGITPIYLAISEEYEELVDFLISQGSDLNNADEKGNTPLHIAASIGNMNIVVSLLKAGADPFINNDDGLKPDVCADAGGFPEVASHIKMVQTKSVFEQRKNK